jgi:ABC-type transport system involved in multi-copper enzyme maturation permease subunit
MFRILVEKELKAIIQSPKFIASFVTFTVLIVMSFYISIQEYKEYENNYNTSISLMNTQVSQADSWFKFAGLYKAFRAPNPMQIFSSGIHNDLGRYTPVQQYQTIKLGNSVYSDDPIYAVFRNIDFTFIVTIVLSLFAILFTYDSVNGERENGTLKLVFSNSVPRSKYILAKFTGSWLGLVVSTSIPILLGLLMLLIFNIHISGADWVRIIMILLVSLLYFSFFIAFGILISTITRHATASFLILLISWISFVFILPRIGIMTAGQFYTVPTEASIESQKSAFMMQSLNKYRESVMKIYTDLQNEAKDLPKDQQDEFFKKRQIDIRDKAEVFRKEMEKENTDYGNRLYETAQNMRDRVERLGLSISRFSPSSLFQLAVMNLSGTDLDLKKRYVEELNQFRTKYNEFVQKKMLETQTQSMRGNMGTGAPVDSKDLPRFIPPVQSLSSSITPSLIDIVILIFLTGLSVVWAFFGFQKYDLR